MKRWTLDQLGEEVACALERVDYVPSASGRVRAVPDRRTIRYYTTIGLVDRPSEIRGRTAYYGRRHLLQLVAIKRLQAEGLSLRRVQERLGGLDDAALAELAQLPAASEAGEEAERERAPAPPRPPEREAFWAARPPAPAPAPPREPQPSVEAAWSLKLGADVTLLLPGGHELSEADLRALQRAAEPLLRELRRQDRLQDTNGEDL
ncbi:MAG TPA: hypothetical protein DEA08_21150 [Planctomycetes bacterium]|nr:hypothetical protein [Planctomycetota bacterium]